MFQIMLHASIFSVELLIYIIYNKRLSAFQAIHSASIGSGHFWQFQTNTFQLLQLILKMSSDITPDDGYHWSIKIKSPI